MSGGSLKGISFIGCVKYLEEIGVAHDAVNLIGTSFGSLVLYMLAMGYSSHEMLENVIYCIGNDVEAPTPTQVEKVTLKGLIKCLERGGMNDGSVILECIKRPLIKRFERSDVTFLDFAKLTGKNLIITGSNLSRIKCEYFSVDTTPHTSVVLALRISTSIPFVFDPVVHAGSVYVDGAVFNNFALDACEKSIETVGILIDDSRLESNIPVTSDTVDMLRLLPMLLKAVVQIVNKESLDKCKPKNDVVYIKMSASEMSLTMTNPDSLGFSFKDMKFGILNSDAVALVEFGYEATRRALHRENGLDDKDHGDGHDDAGSHGDASVVLDLENEPAVVEEDGQDEQDGEPDDKSARKHINVLFAEKDERLADSILESP